MCCRSCCSNCNRRVGDAALAEDLTADTLVGAVQNRRAGRDVVWTVAWVVGVYVTQ